MTKVIDLFTRQPSEATKRTPAELATYARSSECPDFVKRRGVLVITPETKAQTDELFEVMALGIRSDADYMLQLTTWGWLGMTVATALFRLDNGEDFEILERPLKEPDFVDYIEALGVGEKERASAAAKRMGVFDGVPAGHRFALALE